MRYEQYVECMTECYKIKTLQTTKNVLEDLIPLDDSYPEETKVVQSIIKVLEETISFKKKIEKK